MQTKSNATTRPYTGPLPKGDWQFPLPKTGINSRISLVTGKVTSYNVRTKSFKVDGVTRREPIGGETILDLQINWERWHVNNRDKSVATVSGDFKVVTDFALWFIEVDLEEQFQTNEIAKATRNQYRRNIRNHVLSPKYGIGHLHLRHSNKAELQLSLENLRSWVRRMQVANIGPEAIRLSIQAAHAMGRSMVANPSKSGWREDPFEGIKNPRKRRREIDPKAGRKAKYVVDPMITQRMDDAARAVLPAHLGALWKILTGLGCRRGEACGLQWGDFAPDFSYVEIVRQVQKEGGEIEIKPVKGGENEGDEELIRVPIDPEIAAELRKQKAAQLELRLRLGPKWGKWNKRQLSIPENHRRLPGDWVFSDNGLCMVGDDINYIVKRIRQAAGPGAERMTPHKARHDFVSIQHHMGVKPDEIRRNARHRTIATTMRYMHDVKAPSESPSKMALFWQMLREQSAQAV